MPWNLQNIPDQSGKTILITGANSGIGFEAAKALASKNALVILACRNQAKCDQAISDIRITNPKASLEWLPIDLSNLQSIRDAVAQFQAKHRKLDVLINNAGVMWLPRTETADGFEMQLGTNHLGHFALTGLLLDTLLNTPNSRIVTVSSLAHRSGRIHFDDLMLKGSYAKHKAYAQSKLANLMFAKELDRRLRKAGKLTLSVAVHPGGSATNLAVPGFEMQDSNFLAKVAKYLTPMITQSAANGALPTLFGATDSNIRGGEYIGPKHFFEVMGPPVPAYATKYSRDEILGKKLWDISEQLTGIHYSQLAQPDGHAPN
jgi:NAD(P)-dependent dehydrogenase (short-subunit alcohol dehydrogenase family)